MVASQNAILNRVAVLACADSGNEDDALNQVPSGFF
jgi:hypothetical protein